MDVSYQRILSIFLRKVKINQYRVVLDDYGIGHTLKRFLKFIEQQGAEVITEKNSEYKHLEFIRTNLERTERNLVLYNLLAKTRLYLYCLLTPLNDPQNNLGFITRSFFELKLITRYVLMNEENLTRFVAQTAEDKIKFLRAY